jgi:hypothetical protein
MGLYLTAEAATLYSILRQTLAADRGGQSHAVSTPFR